MLRLSLGPLLPKQSFKLNKSMCFQTRFKSSCNNNKISYNQNNFHICMNFPSFNSNNTTNITTFNNNTLFKHSLLFPNSRYSSSSSSSRTLTKTGSTTTSPIINNKLNKNSTAIRDKTLEEDGSNDTKDVIRLFKLAKHDWKMLVVAIALLTLSCSIGMAIPKVIGIVLDSLRISDGNVSIHDLKFMGLSIEGFFSLTLLALAIGCLANYTRVILLRILSERLVARLRTQTIKKILHQDATFFDNYKVGDLISRIGNDAYLVSRAITQKISDGMKALIVGTAGIMMMFTLSVPLSLTLLVMMSPPLLISSKYFGKLIRINSKQLQEATASLTKVTEEQFNGIKTIQSFVAEQNEIKKFNGSIRNIFHVGKESAFINAKFFTLANVIGDLSFLIVLSLGSYFVTQNQLSIGDLTAFMLYTEYTGNAIFNLSSFYSEIMQGVGAATRLFEIADIKPLIKPTIGSKFLPQGGSEIEFNNVTFAYPTRPSLPIFKNLNFKIEQGSNVCIVGPSGKGKSTIAWLLLHYYNPQIGTISIDGKDISKLSTKSLRRKIGVVQQEPTLMSGSIRDNIAYGLTYTPSEKEIRSIAKKCFCHNFITKFPNTYDTIIGPQGTLLSGGQKQRIAIARALIKKPSILILDEATSALDVESESAINYTFGKLMKSKSMTIVSIAHRLSTIRRSENVIVLGNDGAVIETGKFKELFANPNSKLSLLLQEKTHRTEEDPVDPLVQKLVDEGETVADLDEPSIPEEQPLETFTDIQRDMATEGKPLRNASD